MEPRTQCRRRGGVCRAVLALLPLLASCQRSDPPPEGGASVLTDGLGRRVALDLPVQRVVTLAPSNTELLFAIGAGPLLVGRDDHSDFPPEAAVVQAVGTAGGKLQRERIVSLQPDLVLAAEINSPEELRSLEKLGLKTFLISNPVSFPGLYENVKLAGLLTGREDEAAQVLAGLRSRVEEVEERLRGVSRRPTVFYEIDATDPSRPWTAGAETFLHMLITLAGGENLGARFQGRFPRVSVEQVLKSDPRVIILGDGRFGVTLESIKRRPGWGALTAVKEERVHPFDDGLASRPGPRLVEGLETMARLLHPEVFSP